MTSTRFPFTRESTLLVCANVGLHLPDRLNSRMGFVDRLVNLGGQWRFAVVAYVIAILSSLVSGFVFTPENVVKTPSGILILFILINVAFLIRYCITFGVFYFLVGRADQMVAPTRILSAIVFCDIPRTLLTCFSLVIPGLTVIEKPTYVAYGVTSVLFFVRDTVSNPLILQTLALIELFNLSTLILLALFLRRISNLGLVKCFAVNIVVDLCFRLAGVVIR